LADDEFAQYKVKATPAGDEFAQYKTSALPSAASPIAPPQVQKPNIPVEQEPPNFLQQVQQRMGQNIATPLEAIRKTGNAIFDSSSPERQEVMQGLQQPSDWKRGVGKILEYSPPAQIYQMMKGWGNPANIAGDVMTGVALHQATGGDLPQDKQFAPGTGTTPATSVPSPVMGVIARHVPVLGRVLRGIDDIQTLLGKDAPHPTAQTNLAPAKTPIPETNGVQWGTGGQGPLDLRGKMIPQEPQAPQVPEASLIQPPFPGPKDYTVTRGADPFTHPNAPPQWEATHDYSSNVKQYGYHPDSQTISVQYGKGAAYQFKGTQQMYDNMKSAASVGGYIHDVLEPAQRTGKGTYVGTVSSKSSSGQQVSQALSQNQPVNPARDTAAYQKYVNQGMSMSEALQAAARETNPAGGGK